MSMYQEIAEVLSKVHVAPGIYTLRLFSPKIASSAKPGQFLQVRCGVDRDFILRRPFSIHRVLGKDAFEILFQVVGKGTSYLSKIRPNESLDVIGPIGNGFWVDEEIKSALLVSGGIGIAPLIFLVQELELQKTRLHVLLGAADKQRLLYLMDLKRVARKLFPATEDGSLGHKGLVTDLLPETLERLKPEIVYACGPEEMLKKISQISVEYQVRTQISLERRLGCGIGACLACTCRVKGSGNGQVGYKRVCVDGPVFEAADVVW